MPHDSEPKTRDDKRAAAKKRGEQVYSAKHVRAAEALAAKRLGAVACRSEGAKKGSS